MATTKDLESITGQETMRAAWYDRFGLPEDVVTVRRVPRPVPGPGQVLVEVAASAVNALDWHVITGLPYIGRPDMGLLRPRRHIPGADFAGIVAVLGDGVTEYRVGDRVFGSQSEGGFAEYVVARTTTLAPAPSTISLEEAATLGVAGLTALQGLRDWGRMRPGARVLINGASGGVGSFAVQIARALGAGEVVAVCSTANVETAAGLGADRVVDYTKEDFTTLGSGRFDLFLENAGNRPLRACLGLLDEKGSYVMVTGPKPRVLGPFARTIRAYALGAAIRRRVTFGVAKTNEDDLVFLKELVETGKVRPVMDRRYSLSDAVDLLHYQGEGHARGKSIVVVG